MNKEFQGNWQFPDQEITSQEIPVKLKRLSLKIKTNLQKPALGNGQTVLELTSKNMQAELHMGEVSVDHIVEREMGGIVGRFRIQALCKNVVLTLAPGQGSFSVVVAPSVDSSRAGTEVQSVNLSWAPGSWTSQGIQCEGVQGFADILKEEINKIANDSARFVGPQKELIKKYVQDYVQNVQIDFSEPRQLIVARPDLSVVMRVEEFKDLGADGARVKGRFEIQFLRSPDQETKILTLDPNTETVKSEQARLRLPVNFVKEVMKRAYSANAWLHQVTSDKVPGFSTLMNSRFSQLFVWPELRNFSKSAKFRFDVYSHKDIDIQGSGLTYQMKSTLLSKMHAPKGGNYVPFMNFTMPLTSKVQLKVENGKAQATFVNPILGLTPQWDSTYVNKYGPNRRFSSGTIRDRIVGGLWGKTVTVAVPAIPLSEDLTLKIKKVIAPANQDIVLQLAP
ncbi:hypothetical protein [Bdellovibrio bacteriovorus]|uniref:hypothetical protein n=1 Tax=Bdellovibrio TaxID=958 RepID=UPI0035A98F0E